MSRLYDRIMRGRVIPPSGSLEIAAGIGQGDKQLKLPTAQVIECSNVVRYVYEDRSSDYIGNEEMVNIAPPFESMFLETRRPRFMRLGDKVDDTVGGLTSWGLYINALDYFAEFDGDQEKSDEAHANYVGAFPSSGEKNYKPPKNIRWRLNIRPYLEFGKGNIRGPMAFIVAGVHPDGQLAWTEDWNDGYIISLFDAPESFPVIEGMPPPTKAQLASSLRDDCVDPLLFSLCFANSRNVSIETNEPPVKVSKQHRRKYGEPLTRYYTLEIEPMKNILKTEGKSDKTGLKQALHICRGHFKTYTEEKPLFGKRTGTYWWPQTVRGAKKHGEVVKDYAVKAPRSAGGR